MTVFGGYLANDGQGFGSKAVCDLSDVKGHPDILFESAGNICRDRKGWD